MEVTSNVPVYTSSDNSVSGPSSEPTYLNWNDVYMLKGRLLTLIDATFTDPEQRKAQKDIVWQTVAEWARDCDSRADRGPHASK